MPLYDYRCHTCQLTTEMLRSRSDAPPTCDGCGLLLERLMVQKSSFQLKGDGWAKDLYAKPPTAVKE